MNLDFGSELNFIHVSNQKFMNVLQPPFLVAGILILNLVLNLWTDLFSPFFVLAQKHALASQSIRFNDLLKNKSSMLDLNY